MKLRELAEYVQDKELELAYGSETPIKGAFVDEFGFISDAMDDDAIGSVKIDSDVLNQFKEAYKKCENGEEDLW